MGASRAGSVEAQGDLEARPRLVTPGWAPRLEWSLQEPPAAVHEE